MRRRPAPPPSSRSRCAATSDSVVRVAVAPAPTRRPIYDATTEMAATAHSTKKAAPLHCGRGEARGQGKQGMSSRARPAGFPHAGPCKPAPAAAGSLASAPGPGRSSRSSTAGGTGRQNTPGPRLRAAGLREVWWGRVGTCRRPAAKLQQHAGGAAAVQQRCSKAAHR